MTSSDMLNANIFALNFLTYIYIYYLAQRIEMQNTEIKLYQYNY